MKCAMCNNPAEVKVSWLASKRQEHDVCECCAASIWNKISADFSGTDAFASFTILPYERS